MKEKIDELVEFGASWFQAQGWKPHQFQTQTWRAYLEGKHGLVNAPTGSGKTFSLIVPVLLEYLLNQPNNPSESPGLQMVWLTPLRALSREIAYAAQEAVDGLGLNWEVALRTGDSTPSERKRLYERPPEILITTPESLHLMIARRGYKEYFRNLKALITDEWHELIGSKRGVLVELARSRLRTIAPNVKVWGISATIGNLQEAADILLGFDIEEEKKVFIKSGIRKKIHVKTIMPEDIKGFPWAGYLGIRLLKEVTRHIREYKSVLVFTNTRSQCETWFQRILEEAPDLEGQIAMHHGSISREIRDSVENALHTGELRAVVCTSSLDLGVDFHPVEAVIQIGSPKGVARFIQRAGRSGHRPGEESIIYFVPTHALELIEGAAIREAVKERLLEDRVPYIRSFDVLIQYLVTLAVSEGFDADEIYQEIINTWSYNSVTEEEWRWVLNFIRFGSNTLEAYNEYNRVDIDSKGLYRIRNKSLAQRHRLNMGVIVSESSIRLKYRSGRVLGSVEEAFLSPLKPGNHFWFSGRCLKLVSIKGAEAIVRKASGHSGNIPSWMGGRLPLSNQMSRKIRKILSDTVRGKKPSVEIQVLKPLLDLHLRRSIIPDKKELLVEYFEDDDGSHLLIYPFEGRAVHEGLGALIAWRISREIPISFTIAMNDYGFELLTDQSFDPHSLDFQKILNTDELSGDIGVSINEVEMARRRFRDIAHISGLIFPGFPGRKKKDRHLQSSVGLLFDVFHDYAPDNMLYLQAYEEVRFFQLEYQRMFEALKRMQKQKLKIIMLEKPTPLSFPLLVDRLRERLSSEEVQDRIMRMMD